MAAADAAPTALNALLLTSRGCELHTIRAAGVNASYPAAISNEEVDVKRLLENACAVCSAPNGASGFAVQKRGEGLVCVRTNNEDAEEEILLEAEVENTGIYLLAYSPCGRYLSALRRPQNAKSRCDCSPLSLSQHRSILISSRCRYDYSASIQRRSAVLHNVQKAKTRT